jgi:ABC-type phosphate transport system substrate-binding protein
VKLKPSIRLSSRRSRLTALAAAGTATLAIATFAVGQTPGAHADPTVTFVAVGSDTIQDVWNGFGSDQGGNEIGSYNAINPVTAVAHEEITPVEGEHGVNCSFTRPNGSGEGENAIRKSFVPTSLATQLADPPQQNCIDIGRSSSAPGADQKNDGQLIFIPFALDAVTTAIGPTSTLNTTDVNAFTSAELTSLFGSCTAVTVNGTSYNPNTGGNIHLYVPQPGSGTLKFWASKTGGWNPAAPPACDHQTILAGPSSGTAVEEHDGTAVNSDPLGIMPFSIAQWIAQSNSKSNPGGSLPVTDRRHGAVLHEINSTEPCTNGSTGIACPSQNGVMNVASPDTREVYNIVAYDRVVNTGDGNFDANLAGLLATGNSALCQDIFTIQGYGFALLQTPQTTDNCGSTANTLRAFDSTDPV